MLKNCPIDDIDSRGARSGTTVLARDLISSAQSYSTWAGRRRMLDVRDRRFVFAVDIWYLGGEIQNGFGCFCPSTIQDIPTYGGGSTSSSSTVTVTTTKTGG